MTAVSPRDAVSPRFGPQRLYRDAGSMATSSIVSAVLAAGFWALAAATYPPTELGVMTAVMAVIVSTGVVVASGVGDAYTALLPAVGVARSRLYRRGQRVFWVLAGSAGVLAAAATVILLPAVRGSVGVALLVAFGVLMWSAVNVQSSAVVALGRARWLPAANAVAGICKIVLLALLAAVLHWHAVELAFVIATSAMVVALRPAIARVIASDSDLPVATMSEDAALRQFDGFFAQSIASSGLNFGVVTLSPFLVTAFSGPEQGALFALALSVVQVLDLMSMSLAMSLVVHASSAPESAWPMTRAVLFRAVALTGAGSVLLTVFTPIALRILNPAYAEMDVATVTVVLCAVCVVRAVYSVWSGLQRARRRITVPLLFNCVFAIIVPALLIWVCRDHGAVGAAFALLAAQSALSIAAAAHLLANRRREVV